MPFVRLTRAIAFALPLACAALASHAQGRKPITQDTYDLWRTIGNTTLSPDGRWIAYTL